MGKSDLELIVENVKGLAASAAHVASKDGKELVEGVQLLASGLDGFKDNLAALASGGEVVGLARVWLEVGAQLASIGCDDEPCEPNGDGLHFAVLGEPPDERKHSHYFKDVRNIDAIDVYRVLKLFDVTDPCLQHAIKKLLVAGGRGHKDIDGDVGEAIDTLERWVEMRNEDALPDLDDLTDWGVSREQVRRDASVANFAHQGGTRVD